MASRIDFRRLSNLSLLAALSFSNAVRAATEPLTARVVEMIQTRGCAGCHYGKTAAESLAMFTVIDEWELMKSLAYRHFAMRERVAKALGANVLKDFPRLERPSISQQKGAANLFSNNLTRDGDGITDKEVETLRAWFAKGAPLPKEVMDEVFEEIRRRYDKAGK